MTTRLAFLYIGEAYQTYHSASVAFALAARPEFSVEFFYSDPETPEHLERIRKACGGTPLPMRRLNRGPLLRAVQSLRMLGFWKGQVMRENARLLNEFDAVICSEATDSYLRKVGLNKPLLIYMTHGAGDREAGFLPETADFDFVTPLGAKCTARMLQQGLIREGHYAVPGYIKFEVAERLARQQEPIFGNDRPIVLYNAHRAAGISSWPRFIEPIMAYFASQDRYNLVVAPHVKMFHRMSDRQREKWRNRGTKTILVDTGSWACLDMTYTSAASIYIGDVSSQVYEFLATPKPCIFLNAGRTAWHGDKNYAHWHMGDVVDEPEQLPRALDLAFEHHPRYADLQKRSAALSLGDTSPGATQRATDAIAEFLRRARP